MSKIIGNPVGTTLPKPDWNQTDPNKGDYIKNKPDLQTLVGDTPVSEQISTAIKDKADKATTLAGYGITDAAAKNHTHKADEFEINTPLGELQGDTVEEVLMLADEAITAIKSGKADKSHTHDNYIPTSAKGASSGVATLDENGKVPTSQLPSYVDDVLEYDKQSSFPTEGETGKIYIAKDTNKTYRWSGSTYVEISASLALGETSSTAYAGDKGKANAVAISDLQSKVGDTAVSTQIADAIDDKVDKVEGKGLSTNDFTAVYKSKLDGITDSADSVSFSQDFTTGVQIGTITINGAETELYAPPNTDTKYDLSATQKSGENVKLNLTASGSGSGTDSVEIKGAGAANVWRDTESGAIVVESANNTYQTMTGASAVKNGTEGLVPAPLYGQQVYFLRGDGKWAADNDTKNTAGSTNSSSKLFLIGATSQADNPQTYSHDTAYVGTDGCLYSNSTKVSVEGHTHDYDASGAADAALEEAISQIDTAISAITPASIGAAASSHGTHVTWSTTSPKANGTAAVGSETKVARGDHVHPTDTTRAAASDLTALQGVVATKSAVQFITWEADD